MFTFMAGQMRIRDLTAINTVVRRSSAIPLAIFPITFAVAGAITARSGRSAKEMCSTDGQVPVCPHIFMNRVPAQSCQSHGGHKIRCSTGHHNVSVHPCLDNEAAPKMASYMPQSRPLSPGESLCSLKTLNKNCAVVSLKEKAWSA